MIRVQGKAYYEAQRYTTTKALLQASVDRYRDKSAYVFRRKPKETPQMRSYQELGADVERFGTWLTHHYPASPHIAIMGKNTYEWIVTHFAALNGAGISLPLDRQLPAREVSLLLSKGDVDIVVYSPEVHEIMLECSQEHPQIQAFILMDQVSPKAEEVQLPEDERFMKLSEIWVEGQRLLDQGERAFLDATVDPDGLAAIYFTSGTTAASKGVMLSQRNITANVHSIVQTLDLYHHDRLLSVLPLHHTFENTIGIFVIVNVGATSYFTDGLRYMNDNLKEWKITAMIGVPLLFESIYRRIMKEVERKGKRDLIRRGMKVSRLLNRIGIDVRRKLFREVIEALGGEIRLMVVGAAPCDHEVIKGYNDLGINFFQGYGLTEHTPVISTESRQANAVGSVGLPLAEVEVAVDTEGTSYGPESTGEILARSESVMLGYYKEPALTAEVIDEDGWLHTGDVGYLDTDQTLHITGRLKSMIVLANGKKAFPEEIEQLLARIPGVHEAMAWGEQSARDAVDICARFELRHEELPETIDPMDDEAIRRYLSEEVAKVNEKMPSYKAVKYFIFSEDAMIRTTTLKVKRHPEEERIHHWLQSNQTTMRDQHGKRFTPSEGPAKR